MHKSLGTFLPSKKILLLLLVCIIVVGGIIVYSKRDTIKTLVETRQIKKELGTGTVTDFIQEDSDGDGIADWEEPLWGMDPHNPDTNADGVSDGEEINQKRKTLQEKTGVTPETTLNETQKFSREFFGIVASLSAQGTLTDQALQNLAQEFTSSTLNNTPPTPKYSQKDLQVNYTNSDTARITYYTELKKTLTPYLDSQMGLELQVIASGIYLNDNSRIQNLTIPAANYQDIATKLLTVPVPLEAASRHLALVNGFSTLGTTLLETTQILTDPVVGIAGLVAYKNSLDALLVHINTIDIYFKSHDIL